jgi:immune inhibitor A
VQNNKTSASNPVFIILGIVILILCCCLAIAIACLLGLYQFGTQSGSDPSGSPLFDFTAPGPTPVIEVTRPPAESVPTGTLTTLEQTDVPVNDLRDLACRLQDHCNIPDLVPSGPYSVGAHQTFWASDVDTNKNFQVNATLEYVTPHVYFWVQDGVKYDAQQLKNLAEAFENKIYPTDREFFGSEWTPGIDGDPHIYILYARGLGSSIAGYFSSVDEVPPQAHKYSNAHEMFDFNADNVGLGESFTYGVLAHEFQHMIHWEQDRNESSWINEGFSVLAELLNHYDIGGFDWAYISNPDLQLNDWPNNPNATSPHYGAGFLFLTYFLDRFGNEATQALVHDPENGLESVDDVLHTINVTDKSTGKPITADDLFMDWVVTNYLQDGAVGDGRYVYHNYPSAPKAFDTETFSKCPLDPTNRTVHQYGVDYVHITCAGNYTLHFEGATQTGLLPEGAYSGQYAFWSNKGDESDMTLTREFDFSGINGPIQIAYHTWYDLEKDYDYVYVEASTDGKTWQILKTPSCTSEDPSGNSYGCGYNGTSNRWLAESVDLSQYAGQKVQVRFEYVTDAAVNGEGFLLDDVSVPAINYSTDFETDGSGWQAAGFVRVENALPQTFRLALITKGGTGTTVQAIPVNADQTTDVPLTIGSNGVDSVTLVISGTTRFTREDAHYSVSVR